LEAFAAGAVAPAMQHIGKGRRRIRASGRRHATLPMPSASLRPAFLARRPDTPSQWVRV